MNEEPMTQLELAQRPPSNKKFVAYLLAYISFEIVWHPVALCIYLLLILPTVIIFAAVGMTVLAIVMAMFVAMPFIFLWFRWDERGGWAETHVRTLMKDGLTRDEAIERMRTDYTSRGLPISPEVEALR